MNYEQKHKEDLEAAKGWLAIAKENNNKIAIQILEKFFPELRESEDERIRKEIISYIKSSAAVTNKDWIAWLEKQGEQKPVEQDTEIHDLWVYIREWNEKFGRLPKDEDELTSCIDYVMKRQKPSDKIEQNHNWSKEDEHCIELLLPIIDSSSLIPKNRKKCKEFLKSLKERVQPKSMQEWSEEDEVRLGLSIKLIEENPYNSKQVANGIVDWLKSLKPNHWKPSEEQMNSLLALSVLHKESKALESLYNDLKKL